MLTQALGINRSHDRLSLSGQQICLEDHGIKISKNDMIATPRIGIDYAEEHVFLPWRFYIKDNKWVSKKT